MLHVDTVQTLSMGAVEPADCGRLPLAAAERSREERSLAEALPMVPIGNLTPAHVVG